MGIEVGGPNNDIEFGSQSEDAPKLKTFDTSSASAFLASIRKAELVDSVEVTQQNVKNFAEREEARLKEEAKAQTKETAVER